MGMEDASGKGFRGGYYSHASIKATTNTAGNEGEERMQNTPYVEGLRHISPVPASLANFEETDGGIREEEEARYGDGGGDLRRASLQSKGSRSQCASRFYKLLRGGGGF